ncbi:MAG: hypothetical protein COA78_01470 [Blastopirellula sp.]|nr:MAG: hypothetical protein COA78_01470 [Blastopirellula sp.]
MSDNPYESPQADLGQPVELQDATRRTWRSPPFILLAMLSSVAAACILWVSLILVFFWHSTEYWPGWACAVPASVIFVLIFRTIAVRPASTDRAKWQWQFVFLFLLFLVVFALYSFILN